jgi:hypothetical protein
MFNNSLFNEETKLKMAEREREAETHRWHRQLGYSDRSALRWVLGFGTLVAVLLFTLILL